MKADRVQRELHSGFTLIELMLVVAVIGILAGIALPFYGSIRGKPEVAEGISEVRGLQAMAQYFFQENNVAPSIQDLDNLRYGGKGVVTQKYKIVPIEFSPSMDFAPKVAAGGYTATRFVICSVFPMEQAAYVYGLDDKPPKVALLNTDPAAQAVCGAGASGGDQSGGGQPSGGQEPVNEEGGQQNQNEEEQNNINDCNVGDSCPCDGNWKNHGQYVNCVGTALSACLDAGMITKDQKKQAHKRAVQSDCGK